MQLALKRIDDRHDTATPRRVLDTWPHEGIALGRDLDVKGIQLGGADEHAGAGRTVSMMLR